MDDERMHVSVDPHHKVFHTLTDSVNASGLQREGLEGLMEDRGIEPQTLKNAVETLQKAENASVSSVTDEVSTVSAFIERAQAVASSEE